MGASHGKTFAQSTVADMLIETRRSHSVLCLPDSMSVGDALHELAKHGVLSAPITRHGDILTADRLPRGKESKGAAPHHDLLTQSSEVIGVFSVEDVVQMIFLPFRSEDATERHLGHSPEDDRDDFAIGRDLFKQSLAMCQGWSLHNAGFRARTDLPLTDLVAKMDQLKLHRCLVESPTLDADGQRSIIAMLSQSSILKWVQQHMRDERSLKDLALGFRRVHCIRDTDTAIHAIRVMYDTSISGVGIVDADGRLVSAFSLSLLRGFTEDMFEDLALPASAFADKHRKPGSSAVNKVTGLTKFVDCVDTMVEHRLHRVWIVNNFDKPVGIITVSDIVSRLARMASGDINADLAFAEHPKKHEPAKTKKDIKGEKAVIDFNAATRGSLGADSDVHLHSGDDEDSQAEKRREKAALKSIRAKHNAPKRSEKAAPAQSERHAAEKPPTPPLSPALVEKNHQAESRDGAGEHHQRAEPHHGSKSGHAAKSGSKGEGTKADANAHSDNQSAHSNDKAAHSEGTRSTSTTAETKAGAAIHAKKEVSESNKSVNAHDSHGRSMHATKEHTSKSKSKETSTSSTHETYATVVQTGVQTELSDLHLAPHPINGRENFVSPRTHRVAKEVEGLRQAELEAEHESALVEMQTGSTAQFALTNPNLAAVEASHAAVDIAEDQHELFVEVAQHSKQ